VSPRMWTHYHESSDGWEWWI